MKYQFFSLRKIKMVIAVFLVVYFFNHECLSAQTSAYTPSKAKWIFGQNVKIEFASDGSYTTSSGPTSSIPFYAGEGSASVSDRCNGNLLFYTNGMKIWRADGTLMNGGNDVLTQTDPTQPHQTWSSTQGAIIIPVPGSQKRYYIISGDDREAQASFNSITGVPNYPKKWPKSAYSTKCYLGYASNLLYC